LRLEQITVVRNQFEGADQLRMRCLAGIQPAARSRLRIREDISERRDVSESETEILSDLTALWETYHDENGLVP
jgi:hypothetical protein